MKKIYSFYVLLLLAILAVAFVMYIVKKDTVLSPLYSYKVINTFPHDPNAFTQGLVYEDGYLYEGTGLKGQSSIRKVELDTGRVLQKYDLPDEYFGEGITILGDKIYQLHIGQ